jgi:hypothetical protein
MSIPRWLPDPRPPLPDETIASPDSTWSDDDRLAMIAERAYFRAESRGFVPGYELDDWLAAELEIDSQLVRDR